MSIVIGKSALICGAVQPLLTQLFIRINPLAFAPLKYGNCRFGLKAWKDRFGCFCPNGAVAFCVLARLSQG